MNLLLRYAVFLTLITASIGASGQNAGVKIRFIANCGIYMTDGITNIYVDFPYKSGAYNLMEYDLSELDSVRNNPIFIFTHKHADHYSGKLVRKLAKKLDGEIYSPWNKKELLKLNERLTDFTIQAIKTKHKYSVNHCSYLITWHNKKYFISGDTENSEMIASLSDIELAFIPWWLMADARDKALKIDDVSNVFAVYHIGPRLLITNKDNSPKIKLLNVKGELITKPVL